MRVSGSNETKTYGKSAMEKERERKRTLSSRPLCGKAAEERLCLFKDLRPLRAPLEPLFSGKSLSGTSGEIFNDKRVCVFSRVCLSHLSLPLTR
jgi:hypothetical protein